MARARTSPAQNGTTEERGTTAPLASGGGDQDLARVAEVALDALGMAEAGIFRRDPGGGWTRVGAAGASAPGAFCDRVVSRGDGIVVESGVVAAEDSSVVLRGRDMTFHVAVPLRAADTLGVLWLGDRRPRGIDARQRRILDGLAATAVALIERQATARQAGALREILDIAPFGVTVFDKDGRLALHNRWHGTVGQPFVPEVGMTTREILTAGLARRRYPAAYGREAEWLAERLAQREACTTFELELIGEQWRLAHERRTADGCRVTFQADITDLKRQQRALDAALRQAEAAAAALQIKTREIERIAAMSGLGGWEFHPESGRLVWDAVTRRIFDVDDAFVPTLDNALDFYAPRARPVVAAAVRAAMRDGTPFDLEVQVDTAKGRRLWVRAVGGAEMARRQVTLVSGSIQDIDERKSREIEIARIRGRFEAIFENTDAVAFIKMRNGVLLAANRKYHVVAGRSDVVGKSDHELYPQETADLLRAIDKRVFETGQPFVGEEPVIIATGEKVTYLTSKFLIPDPEIGDMVLCGIATDITAQKQLQASLETSRREAERANEVKSQFLATMSHEIRTPMNGVLGMLALLLGSDLDARQRTQATVARDSAKSLMHLLNDILDYSRLEAREVELESLPFDPRALFRDVIALNEGAAADKNLAISCEIAPTVPACVTGDPTRLRQVLGNLVANALKFTDKGSVSVRATYAPEGILGVAIEDTGIGISPEVQKTLFTRFQQADASTTRRFGGSGLGLAICRQLVGAMGGEIGVQSAAGRGAVFRFSVPLPRGVPPDDS